MGHAFTIDVGVIVARETIDNPWQDHRWRAVGVILDAPPVTDWREHSRDGDTVLWHAATLPLELHRKETPAYQLNLASGEPAVWIVLRQDPAASEPQPITVHAVSASPHDVQAYGDSEVEAVQSVAMPEPLIRLVEHFLAHHHVAEPFIKRQRARHHQPEDEKFGQQPIFTQRGRLGPGTGSGNGHA